MQVTCPSCRAAIGAADINIEKTIAKCVRCNAVFDFSDQLPSPSGGRGEQRRRLPVPMPSSVRVLEGAVALPPTMPAYRHAPAAQDFTIVRRWFTPQLFFMVFFCVAWDGFLLFWYSMTTAVHAPLLFSLFPIVHVAVGASLTYATLAGFLNTTSILVRNGTLAIRHEPLPWPGGRTLPVEAIEQLYCERHVSSGRNTTSVTYSLNALLKGGKKLRLLSALPEADQALFIEQCVEERLGIVDVEVRGEYLGRAP